MNPIVIPIPHASEHGVVSDPLPHELPLNAWSAGRNIRVHENAMEKFLGHSAVFGTPTVAPYWLLPTLEVTTYYWIYAGLAKVYVWDGSAHTDITRTAGGDYAATADLNWTGGLLGGIPILNNGVDVPQMWNPVALGTPLTMLTNWNATWVCKSMRPFKRFLVALNISKSGVSYPFMVKWSHPAVPGAVPSSWDETNPAVDAGEWELKETNGRVLDSTPLRDVNVIYKEDTTWGMQFIGGPAIFRFYNIFRSQGALSRRCAVEAFPGYHAVFGADDIILHDGQQAKSLLDRRLRHTIYAALDSTNYERSFVVANAGRREVWFCYPETGNSLPNKALVWNYHQNTCGFRDLPAVAHIEPGIVDPGATSDTWGTAVGAWSTDSQSWNETAFNPARTRLLMADPGTPRLHLADDTTQFNSVNMTASIERTGLGFPLKVGAPPDFTTRKLLTRIWPRIEGTAGGVVNVYIGRQDIIGGSVTYDAPKSYTIGSSKSIDCLVNSPLHALKFESTTAIDWRLHGYEIEIKAVGKHNG